MKKPLTELTLTELLMLWQMQKDIGGKGDKIACLIQLEIYSRISFAN